MGGPLGTEERKVVTVLFADLVDSTGLARRVDPERARELLGIFFEAASEELQALRGRAEKFIGDAVMAVFGLPTVHEDDALRAIRAGLAIRGRLRRLSKSLDLPEPLEVHVGVESGEAATGLGPAGQLLVTGPVVNAAARLQNAAEPGEVLAGPTTVALTANAVSYSERRVLDAKGFDGELSGFPVQGLTPRSARRTIPFVGRSSELAILRESLSRATHSGRPVLVTVLGEPGIGKSRLADELVAALEDSVPVLAGHPHQFTDTATFAPAATIVAELAGLEEGEPKDKSKQRLHELLERHGISEDHLVERLSLLFGMATRKDESTFVADVQSAFVSLIDGITRDTPAVLVFEDAQTLKAPMLRLIERLGSPAREGSRRALVLVLARPGLLDDRPDWGTGMGNAARLRLDPLSEAESIELARQASGRRIEDAEAVEIAERAGGNPFFIIETTGMLLPDPRDAVPAPRGALPPTVQAVVAARLDHLPPRLRELTRRASVFFVSFDLDELHAVDPDATEEEIRDLQDAEILVPEDDAKPDGRWRVRHATLKDVAYAALPKRERVRLHELIADRLFADTHPTWAAEHLEFAAQNALDLDREDRSVAERAANALVAAGDRARRRTESRSATDYYERALALAGPEDRWGVREARALAGIGEARYWLGDYPAARAALDRAIELGKQVDDPFTLAIALRFLGDIVINVDGDVDRAEPLLDASIEQAERLSDEMKPWALARALLFAGWVPWTRDDNETAERIWRRALEVADPDDGWARVRALNSLSINQTGGLERGSARDAVLKRALELSDQASALAEEIGDQFSIAMTTVQRARIFEDQGQYQQAIAGFERAIGIFEDLGARWELGDAYAERGICKRELGRYDEAEQDLKKATRISEELGERQLASWTWRALAEVSERRGDHAEAEQRRRRSREAEERGPR